jgi:hypothetical protein
MSRLLAGLIVSILLPLPLGVNGIVNPVVNGNVVTAGIALPGGLGADLTISFEQAQGLTLQSLGLSAQVANLTDPVLLSRLGGLGAVLIPSAFPVLLRIEPPSSGGLSFTGVVSIELHTHNLSFVPGTPLRLFAATAGGPFRDITTYMGSGSYRARGQKGCFSEFLIVADLRTVDQAIDEKIDRLQQTLDGNRSAIAPSVAASLDTALGEIRAAWTARDVARAIAADEVFLDIVQSHSGADIPNVWRASGGPANAAGLLRAAGETLRFSLRLKGTP